MQPEDRRLSQAVLYTPSVSRDLLISVGIGVVAGFVGGLFGVGGGVVVVPGLVLMLGVGQYRASGTSTATIAVAAAAAVLVFESDGAVDYSAAAWMALGAMVGAAVGARYVDRLPALWVTRTFAGLMLVAAGRMALG